MAVALQTLLAKTEMTLQTAAVMRLREEETTVATKAITMEEVATVVRQRVGQEMTAMTEVTMAAGAGRQLDFARRRRT